MAQEWTNKSRSLKVGVKDNKVTITFNAENWTKGSGEMLVALAREAEIKGVAVADYINDALRLELREHSPDEESYETFLRLCRRIDEYDEGYPVEGISGVDEPN